MTITISENVLKRYKITFNEFIVMMLIGRNSNESFEVTQLIKKGLASRSYDKSSPTGYFITREAQDLISEIIVESEKYQETPERLYSLAKALKDTFPKGKKEGTHYYWSDGIKLIEKRLKLFFKKYGNDFDDEQIIEAAKRYVQSFNGQYKYMQLLKYFIFKEKIGLDNSVESDSQLLNYIEHEGSEEDLKDDWTSVLR